SLDDTNLTAGPFLFTTLAPWYPYFQLNVENGDDGTIAGEPCGCALEAAGYTVHLHHIRSFEKLTSEGMNYQYGDLYDLLERILPSEFGGGPGDYQLVEEEDGRGQTRITLFVHPAVRNLDEHRLLARLRSTLGEGSRNRRFIAWLWHDSGTFRIKREPPYAGVK
ncbi:MAG TPA: hypothetical protein VNO43_07840, partial [Candidatus Eisenbacteria bacterium]|nr:hypothetical protein [Candidatus Eisenbacteria bacterium]